MEKKVTDLMVQDVKNDIKTYGVGTAKATGNIAKNLFGFLIDIPFLGYIIAGFLSLILMVLFMMFYRTNIISIYQILGLAIGVYILMYLIIPEAKFIVHGDKYKYEILLILSVFAMILIMFGLLNAVYHVIGIHEYSVVGLP